MRKLRIGIIGTGGIANAHVNAYKNIPEVEVVAGADIVPGKARAFLDRHGLTEAKAFENHRDLLELDLDAVSVCTYNTTHAVCTIDALNSGKHVLCEKPMSVTLDEAVEMVRAEKKSGKILTIGFQPRYDVNMQMIKQIVQSGILGKVYYISTGGGRRRGMPGGTFIRKETAGVGALADIGCYSLDMVLNAIGYPKPLTVSAYASNYFGTKPQYHPEASEFNVDDFAAAFIRLEGGTVIDFRISWAMHMDTMGDTIFLGENAGLKVKSPGLGSPWGGAWDGGVGPIYLYQDILGQHTETAIPLKQNYGPSIFEKKVRDFVDAILQNRPAPIPTSEILYNQAIIDGIIRSVESGREVEINIPEI
ncbi:Predicted dehydrogenase [Caldanaerobius fijiensis DSM 17918]|uniref:Predicted dehydrogenase n=2 Tax=Caldanaerobius TaxID=862261 RepID=A0A1M4SBF3_9THEO|nr:Gfo/Idh/MocA family oxidoreductase [Caldanaerobius fijiensis]SHE29529.1 Predicted dehydrogenase [Caldanaerobius fijiensis DSM 17918]